MLILAHMGQEPQGFAGFWGRHQRRGVSEELTH